MNRIRSLKSFIRENIEEVKNNKLKNKEDIKSLMRFSKWIQYDCWCLLKEWEKNKGV